MGFPFYKLHDVTIMMSLLRHLTSLSTVTTAVCEYNACDKITQTIAKRIHIAQ
ncbi:hypothetical protein CRENPOLYSF1_470056 [Crenothrix polyspora]|uniref:Uncharacterized protein n=1 Tax=Crenothrix polyspora TaxID=360316 RepID=A0A1R4HC42_9GAMM|nr:hypothetical protein CRENPOLYSF1_470056 [Crenothrix polyspora]